MNCGFQPSWWFLLVLPGSLLPVQEMAEFGSRRSRYICWSVGREKAESSKWVEQVTDKGQFFAICEADENGGQGARYEYSVQVGNPSIRAER